jgi:hypothetical protein
MRQQVAYSRMHLTETLPRERLVLFGCAHVTPTIETDHQPGQKRLATYECRIARHHTTPVRETSTHFREELHDGLIINVMQKAKCEDDVISLRRVKGEISHVCDDEFAAVAVSATRVRYILMIVVDSDVRRDRKMIEHPRRPAADFENTITGPRSNELVNQPLPGTPGAGGRLKCIVYPGDGKQAPRSLLPLTHHPCRGSHSCPLSYQSNLHHTMPVLRPGLVFQLTCRLGYRSAYQPG